MSETKTEKPRRVLQIRTTEQFEKQLADLINGTTLRKKSDVVFLAVQELHERRFPPSPP